MSARMEPSTFPRLLDMQGNDDVQAHYYVSRACLAFFARDLPR